MEAADTVTLTPTVHRNWHCACCARVRRGNTVDASEVLKKIIQLRNKFRYETKYTHAFIIIALNTTI